MSGRILVYGILYGNERTKADVADTCDILKERYNLKACVKLNNTPSTHEKGWKIRILTQDNRSFTLSGTWHSYSVAKISSIIKNLIEEEE